MGKLNSDILQLVSVFCHLCSDSLVALAMASLMFLCVFHPKFKGLIFKRVLDESEQKTVEIRLFDNRFQIFFREVMWGWALVFALCLATPFTYGLVATAFFLLTIAR